MPLLTGGNLLFAQYAAGMRAASAALFLVHRLMLCVYWHEGARSEKVSYIVCRSCRKCAVLIFFSRESQVVPGSTKDIGNVMKLLLTHLWYLSSWDAFHFSIMEPSFVGLEFACGAWMHVLSTRVLWMGKAAFRATTTRLHCPHIWLLQCLQFVRSILMQLIVAFTVHTACHICNLPAMRKGSIHVVKKRLAGVKLGDVAM